MNPAMNHAMSAIAVQQQMQKAAAQAAAQELLAVSPRVLPAPQ